MSDSRQRTTLGTRFRLLVRAFGLTGVVAAVVGFALLSTVYTNYHEWNEATLRSAGEGSHGEFAKIAAWTLAAGLVAVAIALVVELLGALFLMTGRRTVASASATLGTLAALALLVFVNAYSFTHHKRFDFTREKQFTLPSELAERLRSLRSDVPTTIVVLQKHKLFGSLAEERDAFTKAAEDKVTEKVKDLVDLFREFGPRFNVVVFDTEAYGYRQQRDELTKDAPELLEAIKSAPENSIFFHANKRVQRLSFNEFLQLDRTQSALADSGRENLVLVPQGIENFARRVIAVQERRPKVAVCVVHPLLGTDTDEGRAIIGTAGLKKALVTHGFDVIDIVLKTNWGDGAKELEPAALSTGESKLEQLEAERDTADDKVKEAREDRTVLDLVEKDFDATKDAGFAKQADIYDQLQKVAPAAGWLEIVAAYRKFGETNRTITPDKESDFRKLVKAALEAQKKRADEQIQKAIEEQSAASAKVKAALADDRSTEGRREPDVKAKFARLLADVDLLIVPRITIMDAATGDRIDPRVHPMSKEQAEVIKDFMKAGKPVLACLGSISGSNGPTPDANDDFEKLLGERGIELGKDTILFDAETTALANRGTAARLGGAGGAELPPLVIADGPDAPKGKQPNPIGAALRLTGQGVEQKFDLRFRALRPVYLAPAWRDRVPFAAEFITTVPESWNEEKPFVRATPDGNITYRPRFDRTPEKDPKKGTHEEERRGPFPVAVAIEAAPPAYWGEKQPSPVQAAALIVGTPGLGELIPAEALMESAKPKGTPSRLVVFGSGNIFAGGKLEPAQEKLLLHSVNWLTGRNDRLPSADLPVWSFPRVQLSDRELDLWRYGTLIGLPLLAVYLGLMVMMMRRLR